VPSPNWKGLDPASEIATLNFAYHCILTNLLHLRQIAVSVHQTPTAESPDTSSYLDSARRGLQALISLCTSSDPQKTVAYLHWYGILHIFPRHLTPSRMLFAH
jgi:hypothetical protein